MTRPRRLVPLQACLLMALLALPVSARDEPREVRDSRESREVRDDRGDRDDRSGRDADRERDRDREPRDDDRGSGDDRSDRDDRDDRDDDRSDDRGGDSDRGRGEDDDALSRDLPVPRADDVIAFERGGDGHEHRQGEVLMVGEAADLLRVQQGGYGVFDLRPLEALGLVQARVRLAPGESVAAAVERVQALAPQAAVAPNHLFSASAPAPVSAPPPAGSAPRRAVVGGRIGIIDTGAEFATGPLSAVVDEARSFTGQPYSPREHGSVVAAIAAAQGLRLGVADVFAIDTAQRLVAPTDAIASAVDWLVGRRYPVINISIEGPDNAVLAQVVRRAAARGVVVVAAAGNGGPAAAPVYPAAYPDVVAVTAVDGDGRGYRRANRGRYIGFAALGVDVLNPFDPAARSTVSGTSFAAPRVAAEIALRLSDQPPGSATAVLAALRSEARDLGEPGHDPVYGWGWIGAAR